MFRARHGQGSNPKRACGHAEHVVCVVFSRWYAQFLLHDSILYEFARSNPVLCCVLRASQSLSRDQASSGCFGWQTVKALSFCTSTMFKDLDVSVAGR